MKDVGVQSGKSLLHPGEGERQVYPNVARAMEGPPILPYDPHLPTGSEELIQRNSLLVAPR